MEKKHTKDGPKSCKVKSGFASMERASAPITRLNSPSISWGRAVYPQIFTRELYPQTISPSPVKKAGSFKGKIVTGFEAWSKLVGGISSASITGFDLYWEVGDNEKC
ncbi:MAG: hypothetical protein M2R45_03906 [Verrucomicrobia subdivision 3 bacterium]|nr:hypothetical protein [Limisphaerales bacterium]MCS1417513.1 hypothetical protein [Limisphaerales bacterium]